MALDPGPDARIYVCGITPYDATHLGHAATYVAFDLVQRVWRDSGTRCTTCRTSPTSTTRCWSGPTATGEDWTALAERETALFREDMTALRVLPPAPLRRRGRGHPADRPLIERLRDAGRRLRPRRRHLLLGPGRPGLRRGVRAGRGRDAALFAERGGDPDRAGKKNPLDPLVWRAARPGEPAWDSARSAAAGPAGTSSAPRSRSTTSAWASTCRAAAPIWPSRTTRWAPPTPRCSPGDYPFARAYVHAGMVGLDGEKMSKSRGNLVFVSRLRRAGVDPTAIRLALLAHHYRGDWEWTQAVLAEAVERLGRWRAAVSRPDGPPADALLAESAAPLPMTSTPRARWPPSTAGRHSACGRHGHRRDGTGFACGGRPARRGPVAPQGAPAGARGLRGQPPPWRAGPAGPAPCSLIPDHPPVAARAVSRAPGVVAAGGPR